MSARSLNHPIALLTSLAALLAALAAGLRPDSFYSGDQGIKLIAARAALSHPLDPFDVPLPTIGAESTPHVEPFLRVHGEHAHATTSPIFPLLSAPLLALFGLRGLYVLPALGYLATVAGCAALATTLDSRRSAVTAGIVTAIATPFLFYGLEFWEHGPALACAVVALVLLLRGWSLASGALLGISVLLRPEAIWFTAAVAVSLPLLPTRPPISALVRAALGGLIAIAPYEAYVATHFGTLVPPHLGTNAGNLATASWLSGRGAVLRAWFVSSGNSSFWRLAPCVMGALTSLALPRRYASDRFLWSLALVTVVLTALTAPNDGGGQWGTRYLLLADIPLALIAAGALERLPTQRTSARFSVVVLAIACLLIERSGYRQLRSTKNSYGRIVDFVAEKTVESRDIVTDLWWLDQLAAASLADHRLFFAPDAATGAAIVKRLSEHVVPVVHVVRSTSESADTSSWRQATCYFEERRDSISMRGLVSIQLRHRCGQE